MGINFDLVIFDLDGTVIDNRVAIRENFNHALLTHGYNEVLPEVVDRTIGLPLEVAFMKIVPGINSDIAEELCNSYRKRYRETNDRGVVLLDGIPEILVEFRNKGIKLAIATTKADAEVEPLLTKIGIFEYFDMTLGRKEGLKMKPEPDMINYIVEKFKIKPSRTAMIGDTYIDVLAGKGAGVYTVGVLSGVRLGIASREMLEESNPDSIIDSLKELRGLVVTR